MAIPRPAPRVAPATSAILPRNTFFATALRATAIFDLPPRESSCATASLLPAPPTRPQAWAGKSCDQHADTSNRRSKQNPPCGAGKREQPFHLQFPVRQLAHARGTNLPLHPTTRPRVGRIAPPVAPLLQPML